MENCRKILQADGTSPAGERDGCGGEMKEIREIRDVTATLSLAFRRLTEHGVSVVDVLDAHLDVLHAEVHLDLLDAEVLMPADLVRLRPEVDLRSDTLCKETVNAVACHLPSGSETARDRANCPNRGRPRPHSPYSPQYSPPPEALTMISTPELRYFACAEIFGMKKLIWNWRLSRSDLELRECTRLI